MKNHFHNVHKELLKSGNNAKSKASRKGPAKTRSKDKADNPPTSHIIDSFIENSNEGENETTNEQGFHLQSFDCNECQKTFELKFELTMHIKKYHEKPNAGEPKCLPNLSQSTESFNTFKLEQSEISVIEIDDDLIKIEKESDDEISIEFVKEAPKEPLQSRNTHPDQVTKLYKCPICEAKWLHFQQTQDHISQHHHIPLALYSKLGIQIEEIVL